MAEQSPPLTPAVMAASLRGFADGVQALARMIERGQADHATKEQRDDAENAARAVLRNAPDAIRTIRRLEGAAQEVVTEAEQHRDEIMTSMFGPDVPQ
jgi:hypothetical protein